MMTFRFRGCDAGRIRRLLEGDYGVVDVGTHVRIIEDTIGIFDDFGPVCLKKSWRLTYGDPDMFGFERAELLLDGGHITVRLLGKDEAPLLREAVMAEPLYIHAYDVNERRTVYRVFKVGEYAQLLSKGIEVDLRPTLKPRPGMNIFIIDVPTHVLQAGPVRGFLEDAAKRYFVELHVTFTSDSCMICGGKMEKQGRRMRCNRCNVSVDRDVNACWGLARNILIRLGRENKVSLLRELFMQLFPNV